MCRDIMERDVVVGGKLVVMCGDFRQKFPAVRTQVVNVTRRIITAMYPNLKEAKNVIRQIQGEFHLKGDWRLE